MSKNTIIKSIGWRKNFIIRLFCKHEYQYYADTNSSLVSGERRHHICKNVVNIMVQYFLNTKGWDLNDVKD